MREGNPPDVTADAPAGEMEARITGLCAGVNADVNSGKDFDWQIVRNRTGATHAG